VEEKKRLADLLEAIVLLKRHGLQATGVVGAYHARRVAPLMARALLLYGMVPVAQLDGTVLAQGAPHEFEIEQRIREVLVTSDVVFPFAGHLEMQPVIGFINLINVTCLSSLFTIPSGFVMDFEGRKL
jgi:hypothetical protein